MIGRDELDTGSAGASPALFAHSILKISSFNRSRSALITGEGARAPSVDGPIPDQIDLWAKPRGQPVQTKIFSGG